jgi:hypothetical protein
MMWHIAIDTQRLALCAEPILPSHRRSAQAGDSREYQGTRRE